jgi:hypothetical protein
MKMPAARTAVSAQDIPTPIANCMRERPLIMWAAECYSPGG